MPDLACAAKSEPRRALGIGGRSSRRVTAALVARRRIGVVHVFASVPPQPAVRSSVLASRPACDTVPETSPPQPALGRQPSMSAWSTLIWYVRNNLPVGAPDVERFSDTAVIFVSAGAWKRSRAPRPPVQVGSLASPTSRDPRGAGVARVHRRGLG